VAVGRYRVRAKAIRASPWARSVARIDRVIAARRTRNELLEAEIELRRREERVAAMRRELPPGGEVKSDPGPDAQWPRLGDWGPHLDYKSRA